MNHFRRLVKHERLIPTSYTYATLLNAYVNSGDVRGAEEILRRMNAVPGMAPLVVVYTTMLKGHMLSGDVRKAEALVYHEMPSRKPPVEMDARAVNTFPGRGCASAPGTRRAPGRRTEKSRRRVATWRRPRAGLRGPRRRDV